MLCGSIRAMAFIGNTVTSVRLMSVTLYLTSTLMRQLHDVLVVCNYQQYCGQCVPDIVCRVFTVNVSIVKLAMNSYFCALSIIFR